ncbi:uncharacterized protein PSFLO_04896 [Pseudozyma flocculosa]|uniref:Uncharacterized protein n=1 Tax=Pseudozyma flocculosa TaxID=84751 RepID=A0A5C3F6K1_9BASI|nr:uncharacterized protein PSFLO_04896 [Pseudozyma flocculosa]
MAASNAFMADSHQASQIAEKFLNATLLLAIKRSCQAFGQGYHLQVLRQILRFATLAPSAAIAQAFNNSLSATQVKIYKTLFRDLGLDPGQAKLDVIKMSTKLRILAIARKLTKEGGKHNKRFIKDIKAGQLMAMLPKSPFEAIKDSMATQAGIKGAEARAQLCSFHALWAQLP